MTSNTSERPEFKVWGEFLTKRDACPDSGKFYEGQTDDALARLAIAVPVASKEPLTRTEALLDKRLARERTLGVGPDGMDDSMPSARGR